MDVPARRGLPVNGGQQEFGRGAADFFQFHVDTGERRLAGERHDVPVVEADERDIVRHAAAGRRSSEIAKRVDICATAIHHGTTGDSLNELDLSYTPPLASPGDAVQLAAQAWVRGQASNVS